jgi:hypothetical protein
LRWMRGAFRWCVLCRRITSGGVVVATMTPFRCEIGSFSPAGTIERMRCDWASRARRHDCFKVSKVGWLGHTKLTFGRRVPSRPPTRDCDGMRLPKGGICYRAAARRFARRVCLPPAQAAQALPASSLPHRPRRVSAACVTGDPRNARLQATCLNSVDFRRCRMPRLPML